MPTVDEIEARARNLCIEAGDNPNTRQRDYLRSSYGYWNWENYREAAEKQLSEENDEPTAKRG